MNLDNPDDELPKPFTPPPASISKVKQPNKKKNKELTSHIVTGYTISPTLKNNVCDVMLYDIPGHWDAEKITEEINKHLGSIIKASVTVKGKYKCAIFLSVGFLGTGPSHKDSSDFSNKPQLRTYLPPAKNLISSTIKNLKRPSTGRPLNCRTKLPDKKSRGSNMTSKKPKNSSKDSTKKNKPKSQTSSSSSTGSIAEVLATLVKLLMKQESKKSRKHSRSRGGSKAN
ncbi:hypothetical protein C1645_881439 [Glomus cerebriforme]|uniref:Uncharacterized protein n=1 Tax=Glomus cerebriforme TaxID=658196 RepID=A0A397SG49_9GLOM|nr:hypothetical protein C1645_881439 [Glomus cerebriforme]